MAKTVYLIRHGESLSNAGEKTVDAASVELTQKGRDEAQAKADAFSVTPDLIVTSPFIRTKQTAAPFIEKFPGVPVTEWELQEFTFLAPEHYQDKTHEHRYPFLKAYWDRADPYYKEDDSSESFAEFIARCRRIIEKMKETEGDVTLAFGHGYTMAGIAFVLEGRAKKMTAETMQDYWNFYLSLRPANVETMEFKVDGDNVSLVPRARPPSPSPGKKPQPPRMND